MKVEKMENMLDLDSIASGMQIMDNLSRAEG